MISKQTLSLLLAAGTALGTLAASAVAQTSGNPIAGEADGAFSQGSKFGETTGEAMYMHVCAGCHMPDGKGAQGAGFYPALAKNEKLEASGYPAYVVMKGLNGMPPVGEMMSDQQVADVVNYVRTHFGNKYKDPIKAVDIAPLR